MMNINPIPLTVIGGYLGAGKTTFINRALSQNHGKRLFVLVNDFGQINIDAQLLASASDDMITLTNGCICCTMGADLFMAIAQVLDRPERPDHILIEASGVANPLTIANVAKTEPDLSYAGIITLIDGLQIEALLDDPHIGIQIRDQIRCADLIALSKTDHCPSALKTRLHQLNPQKTVLADEPDALALLLFGTPLDSTVNKQINTQMHMNNQLDHSAHPQYTHWSYQGDRQFDKDELKQLLCKRASGLFRIKGFVRGKEDKGWIVQVVGQYISLSATSQPQQTQLVGIGTKQAVSQSDCDQWWQGAINDTVNC